MLFGVEVKCHTLDNGQAIIEADSLHDLLEAMARPNMVLDEDQLIAFTQWRASKKPPK